jgi:hypothetical protein
MEIDVVDRHELQLNSSDMCGPNFIDVSLEQFWSSNMQDRQCSR